MSFRSGAGGGGAGSVRAAGRSPMSVDPSSMFSDYDVPVVAVPSTWRGSASTHEVECGTDPLYYAEQGSQAVHTADTAAQTQELEGDSLPPDVFQLEDWSPSAAVTNFLLKVAPTMNAQLERNAESHAFDGTWQTVCLLCCQAAFGFCDSADAGIGQTSMCSPATRQIKSIAC